MFDRWYSQQLAEKLNRPFVHLLFGARQTGKSTLIGALLPADATRIDLADPTQRARYAADPGEFLRVCRALPTQPAGRFVLVDEAQTAPATRGDQGRDPGYGQGDAVAATRSESFDAVPSKLLYRFKRRTFALPCISPPPVDDCRPTRLFQAHAKTQKGS